MTKDALAEGVIPEFVMSAKVAADIGLLDFVSVLLAVTALIIALGGIFAFVNFRALARRQASEEAGRVSQEVAEASAVAYLEKELPGLIEEYLELARRSANDDMANAIARAQDNREATDEIK